MRLLSRFILPLGIAAVLAAAGWAKWQRYNFHPVLFKNPDQLTPEEVVVYHAYALANGDFSRTDSIASRRRFAEVSGNSPKLRQTWVDLQIWSKILSIEISERTVVTADRVEFLAKVLSLFSEEGGPPLRTLSTVRYIIVREAGAWLLEDTVLLGEEDVH